MKTKFAIGCLVQWYELDIISFYVESLQAAIQAYEGEVIVDVIVSMNQDLEKTNLTDDEFWKLEEKIYDVFKNSLGINNYQIRSVETLYTIADYRREFNERYCEEADVLVWGETDMLVPKQAFQSLHMLHEAQSNTTPKYIATFAICKMWDDTWKPLEHTKFTDFKHSDSKNDWWGLNYDMTIDEMNSFNDSIEQLDVCVIAPHKFNGCGLVISAEVIKAGVNIPKSVFFIHEDTSFMKMTNKVLGDIPQYHFRNLLMVHNRKHKDKRNYIAGETGETVGQKRNSNEWYMVANKMCELNVYNLFSPQYTAYTWADVWKSI